MSKTNIIPVYIGIVICFNVLGFYRQVENDTILYITVPVAVLTFLVGSLLVFMKYRKAIAKGGH